MTLNILLAAAIALIPAMLVVYLLRKRKPRIPHQKFWLPDSIPDPRSYQDAAKVRQPIPPPLPKAALVPTPTPILVDGTVVAEKTLVINDLDRQCIQALNSHNLEQAEEFGRRALEMAEDYLKRDHWLTARVLNNYACVLSGRGMLLEARKMWEESEQICLEWTEQPGVNETLRLAVRNQEYCRSMLGF